MTLASETDIELADGETERIIRDEEANRSYLIEVTGQNPIRVGHTKRYASDGNTLSAGQTHTVGNLLGDELFASAFDGPTAIRVRVAAADVDSQPSKDVNVVNAGDIDVQSRTNASGVTSFSQTINSSTNLISQDVPDGFDVLLLADESNDADVLIDGFPLAPGDATTIGVTDTSQIVVDVESGDQQVHVLTEVN